MAKSFHLDVQALIESESKRLAVDMLKKAIAIVSGNVAQKPIKEKRTKKARQAYSDETRAAVLATIANDSSKKGAARRAAKKHDIPYPTVMRWVKSPVK